MSHRYYDHELAHIILTALMTRVVVVLGMVERMDGNRLRTLEDTSRVQVRMLTARHCSSWGLNYIPSISAVPLVSIFLE